MKRHDYTENAVSIKADKGEIRIRLSWPDGSWKGDKEHVLKLGFNEFYVPCESCKEYINLEDAIMNQNYSKNQLRAYDKRIGLNNDKEVFTDFEIALYCSEQCGVAGEL